MPGLARGERLQIMLSDAELAALDDWRFNKRMPSRASAIRELLKRGLAAEGVVVGGDPTHATLGFSTPPRRHSRSIAGPVVKTNKLGTI